jgi:N6-adenosine-specific RNA methylase IME4
MKPPSLPALPAPSTIAVGALHARCHGIVTWAAKIRDLNQLEETRRWLAAVETYLAGKRQAGPAMTAARLVEARIGALLPIEVGGRGKPSVAPEGLDHHQRHEFRLMHQHRALWESQLPLSRREVLRIVRRVADAETPPITAHAPGQTYRCIVIDPPWDPEDEGDVDQMGRAQPGYGLLPLWKIHGLPIPAITDPDGAHLYLWITNRSLPKGFELLSAWNFRYITALTWCKPSIGIGNYFRNNTEHILFGVQGQLALLEQDIGTWFAADRPGPHSTKPDQFYALARRASPGPRIELFARNPHDGFVAWGAEVPRP